MSKNNNTTDLTCLEICAMIILIAAITTCETVKRIEKIINPPPTMTIIEGIDTIEIDSDDFGFGF